MSGSIIRRAVVSGGRPRRRTGPERTVARHALGDHRTALAGHVHRRVAPGEVYVEDVRIRVAIEDDVRVYRVFHKGITRTCTSPWTPRCAMWPSTPNETASELLSNGLRVELEDYGLLDQIVAAVDGTGARRIRCWDSPSCSCRRRPIRGTPSTPSKANRASSTCG